jgi:hypothetical protein
MCSRCEQLCYFCSNSFRAVVCMVLHCARKGAVHTPQLTVSYVACLLLRFLVNVDYNSL